MSHHVSASPSNPTGAVEVVRTSNPATTSAPVDTGSATGSSSATAGAGASAPAATPTAAPAAAPTGGLSGTPGANLPVPDLEQASTTIQSAQADLSRTTGAERRLDGFDLVGGGGGDGGGGEAEAGVADEGATDAVAAETDGLDVSESGIGGARMELGQEAALTTGAEQGSNQDAVQALASEQSATAENIQAAGAEQGIGEQVAADPAASANVGQQTDPRSAVV